jgi:hypothetical protein
VLILTYVIVIAVIVDSSIARVATSIGVLGPSYIPLFVSIVFVYAMGQHYVLVFVKDQYKVKSHDTRRLVLLGRAVSLVQYTQLTILTFVILQMIFTSSYSILSLRAIVLISYGVSFFVLVLLAGRFILWFKKTPNIGVFVYCVAIITHCIN